MRITVGTWYKQCVGKTHIHTYTISLLHSIPRPCHSQAGPVQPVCTGMTTVGGWILQLSIELLFLVFLKQQEEQKEQEAMEADNSEDIESLMEDMDYIPGHFHLDLNLNCDHVGPVKLRLRDTYLKQESLRGELEAESGYLQYAVRNLLGLMAFHLEQLDTAEEIFRW